jgi:hypothetical protein
MQAWVMIYKEVVLLVAARFLNHSEQNQFDLSGPRQPMLENCSIMLPLWTSQLIKSS